MHQFKRVLLWTALIALILLTVFSIYGAFLGAERARAFFNTVPLAVYWFGFAALLVVGIIAFRHVLGVPSLLLMHAGCILVVAGSMWGSKDGNDLQQRLFGIDRIREGQMAILEGGQDDRVRLADSNDMAVLPFSLRLKDFRIEYYSPGYLMIHCRDGRKWRLPAEPGRQLSLGDDLGTVTVQKVFGNFKIAMESDNRVPYDAPGDSNPAVEVAIEKPDGTVATRYVFERFAGHARPEDRIVLSYHRAIREYISDLEVVKDGKVLAAKEIEVNHPLHYGGYHFYQSSYGQDQGVDYTVLTVVSDSGLRLVYAGYAMLIAGVFWHFWGRKALRALKDRSQRQIKAPADTPDQHSETDGSMPNGN